MRKGALKKKQRQLEELHLDRREALGELVLGMYLQGSWDDDLMARGAAEVREVERELNLLDGPRPDPEKADPSSGEYTVEHDFPATGEYTAEHDLPMTGEHVLRPPSDDTEEHLLPSWRETDLPESSAPETETASAPRPKPAPPASEPAPDTATRKPAEPKRPAAPAPAAPEPVVKAPVEAKQPPTVAPTPSATAPIVSPSRPAAATPGEKPAQAAPTSPAGAEVTGKSAAEAAPETAAAAKTGAAVPSAPMPEDPLARLSGQIEADQRRARNAIEAARATLKTEARTELTVISQEVAADRKKLDSALKAAAGLISESENRAAAAEAKLTRESAAGREAAADWVRTQAAEIEADAALAVELEQEGTESPTDPGPADQVLTARVASLEAELAAEKAARTEALVTAQARLKEIEASARAAEERVAAAEAAAATATGPESGSAPDGDGRTEAEAREAAVAWLRGQIAALRKELTSQAAPGPADDTTKGDG